MKKMFLILLAAPMGVFAQQSTFTLTGQLKNVTDSEPWVYLSYVKDGKSNLDSAQVTDGKYTFKGEVSDPVSAVLFDVRPNPYIRMNRKDYTSIFIEPAVMSITHTDSFSNVLVTGSKANVEFTKLKKQLEPFSEKMQPLVAQYREAYNKGDKAAADQLEKQLDQLDSTSKEEVYGAYVRNNPASPIALYALQNYSPYDVEVDKVEPLFNNLSATNKASTGGVAFRKKIDISKKTSVGRIAPDFTQNDTLGNPVSLTSFRGKVVLVDFWASWCGPCRAENPNVVKAFNKYKEKGFQVLGVSLDRPGAKEKWIEAIHKDGLTWTHVSDLQWWNNAVAQEYGIQSIPANFLLDPTGKIIGKSLRGEDLEKKLEEIYKD